MKREPSVDAERIARNPVTFRLRKTVPEATSYTKSRLVESPITRLPEAVVTNPARNPAGVGLAGMAGIPIGGVAGGEVGTGETTAVAGSSRNGPTTGTTVPIFAAEAVTPQKENSSPRHRRSRTALEICRL